MQRILRLPEVMKMTGLSRSSVYLFISKGQFPKQITLGRKSVGWLLTEVEEWLNERINQRDIAA